MKKLSIKETQDILLSIMIDFDALCRKEHLNYYMIGGTMLGAFRHNGFIPWDDDIDVGMIRSEYEKFIKRSGGLNKKYEVKNYRVANNCDYVITRIYMPGVYIDNPYNRFSKVDKRLYFDIFPLDYVPDEERRRKEQRDVIEKLKRKMALMDVKAYNHNAVKTAVKYLVSCVLSIRRQSILTLLDNEMSKYDNTSHLCSMASQYSYEKQVFDISVYGEPMEYYFEGHKFFGPKGAETYLSQLYGKDFMQLPPIEDRRSELIIYSEN